MIRRTKCMSTELGIESVNIKVIMMTFCNSIINENYANCNYKLICYYKLLLTCTTTETSHTCAKELDGTNSNMPSSCPVARI